MAAVVMRIALLTMYQCSWRTCAGMRFVSRPPSQGEHDTSGAHPYLLLRKCLSHPRTCHTCRRDEPLQGYGTQMLARSGEVQCGPLEGLIYGMRSLRSGSQQVAHPQNAVLLTK